MTMRTDEGIGIWSRRALFFVVLALAACSTLRTGSDFDRSVGFSG